MLGTVLPAIFLGVAAFLLNVVVSRLVATQREQIAALKALGYPNRAIAAHYLKLVLLIVRAAASCSASRSATGWARCSPGCTPSSSASRASSTASRRGCWSSSVRHHRRHRGAGHAQRDRRHACGWRRPRRCARRRPGATGARCSSGWASQRIAPGAAHDPAQHGAPAAAHGAVDRRRRGGGGDRRSWATSSATRSTSSSTRSSASACAAT